VRYLFYGGVLLVLAWLLTGLTQVRPGERAVVRRFGRVLDDKPRPGLYIGLPWGLERVDRVATGLLRQVTVGVSPGDRDDSGQTTPPGQLLTGDHNLVNVQVVIDYAVSDDDDDVVNFVLQQDKADGLVARAAEAVMAEWVAGRTVDDVLLRGKVELPSYLVARTQERILPYRLGVRIQDASVTYLNPPAEVKNAFDEVTRAQTGIRTEIYKAEQDADRQIREAQAEQFRSQRLTAAYAREQRLLAQAEAENFEKRLAQYRELSAKNPYYLNGVWWDEISRLYARMRANGRIDLLDHHLAADGLDITQFPPLPKKK
jgi:membrane protease subunit HflK